MKKLAGDIGIIVLVGALIGVRYFTIAIAVLMFVIIATSNWSLWPLWQQ
jgi:hypothetical protein